MTAPTPLRRQGAAPATPPASPDWVSRASDRSYETTPYHWHRGTLRICPACNMAPCHGECVEQAFPPPPGSPADRAARRVRGETVEEREAAVPAVMVGNGNPDLLVAAAFAEAKRRKQEKREDQGEA